VPALQASLFHITMWHLDLGYLSRSPHHRWPQQDAGMVLRSLSVAANDWQSRECLARLSTIPINAVLDQAWGHGFLCDGGGDSSPSSVVWAPRT
jgi:hypothetical protein